MGELQTSLNELKGEAGFKAKALYYATYIVYAMADFVSLLFAGTEVETYWLRYNWTAFRNPIHNLALYMGVKEPIVGYVWFGNRFTEDRVGHEGF